MTLLTKRTKFKILSLISLGSAMEFYDFTIYGIFSVFMKDSFFPKSTKDSSINFIAILMIFGVGYIARSFGGFIFGNLGDKLGRKYSFRISLFIMAISTFCVGIAPTYAQVGIYAPIILLCLRIIQGISMGAELPISSVFVFEHLSHGKNIFYGATLFGLSNIGLLLANIVNFTLTNSLNSQEMRDFGWRIPFLLGSILCIIAIYLRKRLNETAVFKNLIPLEFPWKHLLKNYKRGFIASTLLSLPYGLCVNFGFVLLFSILEQLYKTPEKTLVLLTLISTLVFCFVDSVIGAIVDRYKIKLVNLILFGAVQFGIAFYFILFNYANNNFIYGFLCMLWLTFATSCFDSTIPNILPRIFPDKIRSIGVALSYSIGLAISSIITVFISTIVIGRSMNPFYLPLLVFIAQFISILCAIKIIKNKSFE